MENPIQAERTISHELIEEQLRRIRNCPEFSRSRRYPIFLDYIVLKAATGHQEDLKERTIGVEAFGRDPQYDLNTDPIVRVTAAEVRKRLAQYYYEPERQAELRIEIRPGSYVPEFKFVSARADAEGSSPSPIAPSEPLTPLDEIPPPSEPKPETGKLMRTKRVAIWTVAVVAAVVIAILALRMAILTRGASPFDQIWEPVISSPGPVLISVGSVTALNPPTLPSLPPPGDMGIHALFASPVALADTIAISNLTQVLSLYAKASTIQSSTSTTYSDLQRGPVILVSGFDNPWTMRLTAPLRFHFVQASLPVYEIIDRTDPVHKVWPINVRTPFDQVTHDYGIVARFHDPSIDQVVVVAAGIGEDGTIAASEFLSDKRYLLDAKNRGLLPTSNQNWEAVIETKMIDGKPGPPRIVASYEW